MLTMTGRAGPQVHEAADDSFKAVAPCNDPQVVPNPKIFFPYGTGYRPSLPKHNPLESPLVQAERNVGASALAICATCPVKAPCLAYALSQDEFEGIWGNTTPTERRLMVRVKRTRRVT